MSLAYQAPAGEVHGVAIIREAAAARARRAGGFVPLVLDAVDGAQGAVSDELPAVQVGATLAGWGASMPRALAVYVLRSGVAKPPDGPEGNETYPHVVWFRATPPAARVVARRVGA